MQELNIPVPPAVLVNSSNNCSDGAPPAKRSRVDDDGSDVPGTRVYSLPNGSVHCNKPLCDLIHIVKPRIRQLVEDSNLVWNFW